MKAHTITLSFIFIFIHGLTFSQSEQQIKTYLDSVLHLKQTTFEVPGLSVGILKEGAVWYSKNIGVQSLHTKTKLTDRSIFHMASVSKPFTATAVMHLIQEGKLDLRGKIVNYLPQFSMADPRYKAITLQQLLTHTSGIPDVEDYEWERPEYDDAAALRYVQSFKNDVLDFAPGSQHNYSNAGYNLLAAIVQKASGSTFEDYVKNTFFRPLNMNETTFLKTEITSELATSPHVISNNFKIDKSNVYPYNRIHAPSSTLHSNTVDMLKWAQFCLNKKASILDASSYTTMLNTYKNLDGDRQMHLGWFSTKIGDDRMYYHSGGDEGYSTFFAFIPSKNIALVMMANSDTIITQYLAQVLLHKLLLNKELNYKTPISFALRRSILEKGIEGFKKDYFKFQKEAQERYSFGRGYLDGLGYDLLDSYHHEKAVDIFKFHVSLQPDVPGFYDSVGDGYAAWNKPELALEWYKKARDKDPEKQMSVKKIKALEAMIKH